MNEPDCLYEAIVQKYSRRIDEESVPHNHSSDMTMLLSTLNIFRNNSDHSLMAAFFEDFMKVLNKVPPQSLSLVWGKDEVRRKILGFPRMDTTLAMARNKKPAADIQDPSLWGSNTDHDPLRLTYRLVEACRDSIQHVLLPEERLSIFHALLLLGGKSARAHILLECAWQLLCFGGTDSSYGVGDPQALPPQAHAQASLTLDVALLSDMRAFLAACSTGKATAAGIEHVPSAHLLTDADASGSDVQSPEAEEGTGLEAGAPRRTKLCVSFGKADHGKLGHGDTVIHRQIPTIVECLREIPIVKTTSMSTYVVALDEGGNPYVWGTGGSAGNTTEHTGSTSGGGYSRHSSRMDIKPQLLEALSLDKGGAVDRGLGQGGIGAAGGAHVVVDISCGLGHALFLLSSGRVLSWGNGGNGRLGLNDLHDRAEASLVTALENEVVTQVQCGASHSLAVTDTGKLYSWGKNSQGQCGIGSLEDALVPTLVSSLRSGSVGVVVHQVAAGWEHTVILTSGGLLYSCGCGYKDNRRGIVPPVLGLGHNEGKTTPELISSLVSSPPPAAASSATGVGTRSLLSPSSSTSGLTSGLVENILQAVGMTADLGISPDAGSASAGRTPPGGLMDAVPGSDAADTAAVDSEDEYSDAVGRGVAAVKADPNDIIIARVSCGWDHCLALDVNGRTFSWGSGQNGKLGHGNEDNFAIPCIVPALENIPVSIISAGCEHSCAVSADGYVYTWGHGDGGRLGHGDNNARVLPTLVKSFVDMNVEPIDVHCGDKFTIMVVQDSAEPKSLAKAEAAGSVGQLKAAALGAGAIAGVPASSSDGPAAPLYSWGSLVTETEKLFDVFAHAGVTGAEAEQDVAQRARVARSLLCHPPARAAPGLNYAEKGPRVGGAFESPATVAPRSLQLGGSLASPFTDVHLSSTKKPPVHSSVASGGGGIKMFPMLHSLPDSESRPQHPELQPQPEFQPTAAHFSLCLLSLMVQCALASMDAASPDMEQKLQRIFKAAEEPSAGGPPAALLHVLPPVSLPPAGVRVTDREAIIALADREYCVEALCPDTFYTLFDLIEATSDAYCRRCGEMQAPGRLDEGALDQQDRADEQAYGFSVGGPSLENSMDFEGSCASNFSAATPARESRSVAPLTPGPSSTAVTTENNTPATAVTTTPSAKWANSGGGSRGGSGIKALRGIMNSGDKNKQQRLFDSPGGEMDFGESVNLDDSMGVASVGQPQYHQRSVLLDDNSHQGGGVHGAAVCAVSELASALNEWAALYALLKLLNANVVALMKTTLADANIAALKRAKREKKAKAHGVDFDVGLGRSRATVPGGTGRSFDSGEESMWWIVDESRGAGSGAALGGLHPTGDGAVPATQPLPLGSTGLPTARMQQLEEEDCPDAGQPQHPRRAEANRETDCDILGGTFDGSDTEGNASTVDEDDLLDASNASSFVGSIDDNLRPIQYENDPLAPAVLPVAVGNNRDDSPTEPQQHHDGGSGEGNQEQDEEQDPHVWASGDEDGAVEFGGGLPPRDDRDGGDEDDSSSAGSDWSQLDEGDGLGLYGDGPDSAELQLQRTLLMSVGEGASMGAGAGMGTAKNLQRRQLEALRSSKHEVSTVFPQLRDVLEDLMAHCYRTVTGSNGFAIDIAPYVKTRLDGVAGVNFVTQAVRDKYQTTDAVLSAYSLWFELRSVLSNGFLYFYSKPERKKLLVELMRNPGNVVPLVPVLYDSLRRHVQCKAEWVQQPFPFPAGSVTSTLHSLTSFYIGGFQNIFAYIRDNLLANKLCAQHHPQVLVPVDQKSKSNGATHQCSSLIGDDGRRCYYSIEHQIAVNLLGICKILLFPSLHNALRSDVVENSNHYHIQLTALFATLVECAVIDLNALCKWCGVVSAVDVYRANGFRQICYVLQQSYSALMIPYMCALCSSGARARDSGATEEEGSPLLFVCLLLNPVRELLLPAIDKCIDKFSESAAAGVGSGYSSPVGAVRAGVGGTQSRSARLTGVTSSEQDRDFRKVMSDWLLGLKGHLLRFLAVAVQVLISNKSISVESDSRLPTSSVVAAAGGLQSCYAEILDRLLSGPGSRSNSSGVTRRRLNRESMVVLAMHDGLMPSATSATLPPAPLPYLHGRVNPTDFRAMDVRLGEELDAELRRAVLRLRRESGQKHRAASVLCAAVCDSMEEDEKQGEPVPEEAFARLRDCVEALTFVLYHVLRASQFQCGGGAESDVEDIWFTSKLFAVTTLLVHSSCRAFSLNSSGEMDSICQWVCGMTEKCSFLCDLQGISWDAEHSGNYDCLVCAMPLVKARAQSGSGAEGLSVSISEMAETLKRVQRFALVERSQACAPGVLSEAHSALLLGLSRFRVDAASALHTGDTSGQQQVGAGDSLLLFLLSPSLHPASVHRMANLALTRHVRRSTVRLGTELLVSTLSGVSHCSASMRLFTASVLDRVGAGPKDDDAVLPTVYTICSVASTAVCARAGVGIGAADLAVLEADCCSVIARVVDSMTLSQPPARGAESDSTAVATVGVKERYSSFFHLPSIVACMRYIVQNAAALDRLSRDAAVAAMGSINRKLCELSAAVAAPSDATPACADAGSDDRGSGAASPALESVTAAAVSNTLDNFVVDDALCECLASMKHVVALVFNSCDSGSGHTRLRRLLSAPNSGVLSGTVASFLDIMEHAAKYTSRLLSGHHSYLWTCYQARVSYFMPKKHTIESASPTIIINLMSGLGFFTLGFWLYVPQDSLRRIIAGCEADKPAEDGTTYSQEIHLLSRVPEIGNFNMIELCEGQMPCLCHPNVSLLLKWTKGAPAEAELSVVVISTAIVTCDGNHSVKHHKVGAGAGKGKCVRLVSEGVATDRWIKINVSFQKSVKPAVSTSAAASGGGSFKGLRASSDGLNKRGLLLLSVNNTPVDRMEGCLLMPHAAHQNVILGSLPRLLHRYETEISLCDIYWSSVPLQPSPHSADGFHAVSLAAASSMSSATAADILPQHPSIKLTGGSGDPTGSNSMGENSANDFFPHSACIATLENMYTGMNNALLTLQLLLNEMQAQLFMGAGVASASVDAIDLLKEIIPRSCASVIAYFVVGTEEIQDLATKVLKFIVLLLARLKDEIGSTGNTAPALESVYATCRDCVSFSVDYLTEHVHVMLDLKTSVNSSSFSGFFQLHSATHRAKLAARMHDVLKGSGGASLPLFSSYDFGVLSAVWINRIAASVVGLNNLIGTAAEWSHISALNESIIITSMANVVSAVLNSKFASDFYQAETLQQWYARDSGGGALETQHSFMKKRGLTHRLLLYICAGGWPTVLGINRSVEVSPRAFFLFSDPKYLEETLFPDAATIVQANYLRPVGFWLSSCAATFNRTTLPRIDATGHLLAPSSADAQKRVACTVPSGADSTLISCTEMATGHDLFQLVTGLEHLLPLLQERPMIAGTQLVDVLTAGIVSSSTMFSSVGYNNSPEHSSQSTASAAAALPPGSPSKQLKASKAGSTKKMMTSSSFRGLAVGGEEDAECSLSSTPLHDHMVQLRALMVKLSALDMELKACSGGVAATESVSAHVQTLSKLLPVLVRDIPAIMSIASMSPIAVVSSVFEGLGSSGSGDGAGADAGRSAALVSPGLGGASTSAASKITSAANALSQNNMIAYKGAQLDVLKNLLRDSDLNFLEKIAQRLWTRIKCGSTRSRRSIVAGCNLHDFYHNLDVYHQYYRSGEGAAAGTTLLQIDDNYTNYVNTVGTNNYNIAFTSSSLSVHIVPLAGEVQIFENRVRGVSHFPSILLQGVALEKRTGRWYYEVLILSDGLMQIGWADTLFKCDPLCGQGVGDHQHSWAYDGMRSKKWSVSCDTYGKRWHVGDVVGVLLDTDLLEMRYFLNGEDLGAAFTDFKCNSLIPAISLNVRQCLRINFGEQLFAYPPDTEYDGYAFRSIRDAFVMQNASPEQDPLPAAPRRASGKSKPAEAAGVVPVVEKPVSATLSAQDVLGSIRSHRVLVMRDGAHDEEIVLQDDAEGVDGADQEQEQEQAGASRTRGGRSRVIDGDLHDGEGKDAGIRPADGTDSPKLATAELPVIDGAEDCADIYGNVKSAEQGAGGAASLNQNQDSRANLVDDSTRQMLLSLGAENGEEDDDDDDEEEDVDYDDGEGEGDDEDDDDDDRGEDDDEDDEEDDEEEDDDDDDDDAGAKDDDDDDDGAYPRASVHELELRRQSMVENLVALGFPIEWVLRAAEQCDLSTPEATVVTWILERMETEQARLEEYHGDSSRVVDEEQLQHQHQESGSGLSATDVVRNNSGANSNSRNGSGNHRNLNDLLGQELMLSAGRGGGDAVRSAAHATAGANGADSGGVNSHLLATVADRNSDGGSNSGAANSSSGVASGSVAMALLHSGSGVSQNLSNAASTLWLRSLLGEDTGSPISPVARVMDSSASSFRPLDADAPDGGAAGQAQGDAVAMAVAAHRRITASNSLMEENTRQLLEETVSSSTLSCDRTWNNPVHPPAPVLIGRYTAKRRHDTDKEEVLAQVSDLEHNDMYPIVASCEFSLCVLYSRMVTIKLLSIVAQLCALRAGEEAAATRAQMDAVVVAVLGQLLASDSSLVLLNDVLRICFKQSINANANNSERLFPNAQQGSAQGEPKDRVPAFPPFASSMGAELEVFLSQLEYGLYKDCLQNTLAAEESGCLSVQAIERFVALIINISCDNAGLDLSLSAVAEPQVPLKQRCEAFLSLVVRDCTDAIDRCGEASGASSGEGGKRDWISAGLEKDSLEDLLALGTGSKGDNGENGGVGTSPAGRGTNVTPSSGRNSANGSSDADNASVPLVHRVGGCFKQKPFVVWCHFILRFVLKESHLLYAGPDVAVETNQTGDAKPAGHGTRRRFNLFDTGTSAGQTPVPYLATLTSAGTLGRLLKSCGSANMSLKYCIFDLGSYILSLVNMQLSSFQLQRRRHITEMIMQSQMGGGKGGGDLAADARAEAALDTPYPAELHLAAEYYISVTKERRLLQVLSTKLMQESPKKLCSLYSRSICRFLFQWQQLRRVLGLFSDINCVREFILQDWVSPLSAFRYNLGSHSTWRTTGSLARGAGGGGALSALEADDMPVDPDPDADADLSRLGALLDIKRCHRDQLLVRQVSSNSVTVSWKLKQLQPSALLEDGSASPGGVASLYITLASNMGGLVVENQQRSFLVKADCSYCDSHRIDNLDADTMYQITLVKDELNQHVAAKTDNPASDVVRRVVQAGEHSSTADASGPASADDDGAAQTTATAGGNNQESWGGKDSLEGGLQQQRREQEQDLWFSSTEDEEVNEAFLYSGAGAGPGADGVVTGTVELLPVVKTPPASLSTYVSTEPDPVFLFDTARTAPNLIISNAQLTVRNSTNKKWSTVRGNVKMTSGIYRWDVHVDKCISKNIFIGVCTEDARLDNYIGCDRHGWAFLANKAIWHNKSKLKGYGELFHGGDTVSIMLDMDKGLLQYWLNGNPMGPAVEGLNVAARNVHGNGAPVITALYPAFSLYNEDDQLSLLLSKRSFSMHSSTYNINANINTSMAERVLDRVVCAQSLMEFLHTQTLWPCHSGSGSTITKSSKAQSKPPLGLTGAVMAGGLSAGVQEKCLAKDLRIELYRRFKLWHRDVHVLSASGGGIGDFVSIVMSTELCEAFIEGYKINCGDTLLLTETGRGRAYVVTGVCRHRLWMQAVHSRELVGFTRNTLYTMISQGNLEIMGASYSNSRWREDPAAGAPPVASDYHPQTGPLSSWTSIDAFINGVQRYAAGWSARHDEMLVEFLDSTATYLHVHPLMLPRAVLERVLRFWKELAEERDSKLDSPGERYWQSLVVVLTDEVVAYFSPLLCAHTVDDLLQRTLCLLHLNDLMLALQSVLTPLSGDEIIAAPGRDTNPTVSGSSPEAQAVAAALAEFGREARTTAEVNYPVHVLLAEMRGYVFNRYHMDLLRTLTDGAESSPAAYTGTPGRGTVGPPPAVTVYSNPTFVPSALCPLPDVSALHEEDPSPTMLLRPAPLLQHYLNLPTVSASSASPLARSAHVRSAAVRTLEDIATSPFSRLQNCCCWTDGGVTAHSLSAKVFYIDSEVAVARKILRASGSSSGGSAGGITVAAETAAGRDQLLLSDPRWMLVAGIQSSLIGQLRVFLETVASSPTAGASTAPASGDDSGFPASAAQQSPSQWESRLRLFRAVGSGYSPVLPHFYRTSPPGLSAGSVVTAPSLFRYEVENVGGDLADISARATPDAAHAVPFVIRLDSPVGADAPATASGRSGDTGCDDLYYSSNIIDTLNVLHREEQLLAGAAAAGAGRSGSAAAALVSEWYVLEVFLLDALRQAQRILDQHYFSLRSRPTEGDAGCVPGLPQHYSAGEVAVLLQYMQLVGVAIGFVLRLALPCTMHDMRFSLEDCTVLVCGHINPADGAKPAAGQRGGSSFASACLLAIRTGIMSIYPEVSLKMLKPAQLRRTLCPRRATSARAGAGYNTATFVPNIQPLVSYDPRLLSRPRAEVDPFSQSCSAAYSIQLFWTMLGQLSAHLVGCFVGKVIAFHDREKQVVWSGWARTLHLGPDGEEQAGAAGQMLLHFSCLTRGDETGVPATDEATGRDLKLFHLSVATDGSDGSAGPDSFQMTFDADRGCAVLQLPAHTDGLRDLAAAFIAFLHT